MSNKHLNLTKMNLTRGIAKPAGIITIVVLTVAILWTSLPIEANPDQAGFSGVGTPDFSSLTLQCELETGIVFRDLIPGPQATWSLSLSGDCVWQVHPAVTIVGRGSVIGSVPCLSTNPGSAVEFTAINGTTIRGTSTQMNTPAQDAGHVDLSLDRLFLQYESGRARAIVGKQAVNWGLATLFRPTDLITPRDPGGSGEGRPGKVLATLFWRTSPLTGVEVVLGEDLYAGRVEFRVGQANLGILGLTKSCNLASGGNPISSRNPAGSVNPTGSLNTTHSNHPVYSGGAADSGTSATIGNEISITSLTASGVENAVGLDFQGGLGGFYGEVCHRWTDIRAQSSGIAHSDAPAEMSTTSGTIGWKTMLRGGNLVFAEYYRNHVRLGNISAITQLAALGLTYQYDEFTTLGLVGVTDLADDSWTATGTLTSLLTENLDLNCGVSITNGPHAQAKVMLKWYL